MNNDRRLEIAKAADLVGEASALIAQASAAVEQARDDEQEYLNGMPEGFKQGERGSIADAAIAALDEALNELQQIGTAEIVASLEEATELSLQVETVPKRLTSKQAEERRWARLPQWAKDRIERLQADVERANAKASSVFSDPAGGPEEVLFYDYMEGPFHQKALPIKRVEFPAHGVRVEADSRGVLVHANNGMVIVRPCTSNEVIVKAEPWA